MSKYTTEVRYICEKAAGLDDSVGYNDVDSVIESAIPSVFNFDFPIFDDDYKNVICAKILRHYYTREIGFETVGLWKLKLETKLTEIMPYFNQLYKSELLKFNPLYDTDLHTTHVGDKNSEMNREESKTGISSGSRERTENGSLNTTADNVESNNVSGTSRSDIANSNVENNKSSIEKEFSESDNRQGDKVDSRNYNETTGNTHYDLYSDTPQGGLTGVESQEYLTNARKITDSGSKNGKEDSTEATQEKGSKSGESSETGEVENSRYGNENIRNNYEENNDKTNVSNEKQERTGSISDADSRSDFENMNGKDKFNSTESYVLHVVGKQGGMSYSKLLNEFRKTFLNIDMDVINSLSDLFLNLW